MGLDISSAAQTVGNVAQNASQGGEKKKGLLESLGLTEQQGEKLLQGLVMTAAGGAIGGKKGAGIGAVFALLNAMGGQENAQGQKQQGQAGQNSDENPQGPGQQNLSVLV